MNRSHVTALDERLAAPMFWATVLFLTMCAGVLHLRDDTVAELPNATASAGNSEVVNGARFAADAESDSAGTIASEVHLLSLTVRSLCLWGMLLLLPLFALEAVLHCRAGGNQTRRHLLSCLLPPLRLGIRDHQAGQSVWLPCIGWATADETLLRRVERGAKWPMILIATLVLPLLAFEHFYLQQIQSSPWLNLFVQISAALIWLAFAFEFVVMISIAEQKWRYAREHWIDALIILIPMIDVLRALRLSRLLRMQQVVRALRLVRLKGTLLRAWRAVLLLEAVDRFARPRPEKRLQQLHRLVIEQELQLAELKQEIAKIEDQLHPEHVLRGTIGGTAEESAA